MGIPRLRHHLSAFAETAILQQKDELTKESSTYVQSVVIDGPSLVYNVFSRLLSWFSELNPGLFDAVPTCNEVSCGVMIYLLQLRILGVKIEGIYFDGALPPKKHSTRVLRLENSRKKLETFYSKTSHGSGTSNRAEGGRTIKPEHVLSSRTIPARYNCIPDNPFMVPTVFEDLNSRWDKESITCVIGDLLPVQLAGLEDYPWATVTHMVPGEADAYCVYMARLSGSTVLTNDSDLLVYELGPRGSVVFLDSVELLGHSSTQPMMPQITAAILRPDAIAGRLGIPNILSLAYELKSNPAIGMVELLRRPRALGRAVEDVPGYQDFAGEYQNGWVKLFAGGYIRQPKCLDARVSELFWQYELRCTYMPEDCPHMYLAPINEDCSRQCVWTEGRLYRSIGYSVLNNSRPTNERFSSLNEYARRGRRITEEKILLGERGWTETQIEILRGRLLLIRSVFEEGISSPAFWRILVLCDLYDKGTKFTHDELQTLTQFLRVGYMGRKQKWADFHLTAQIQSILYSLRILRQLLEFADENDKSATDVRLMLDNLPSLHVMMAPVCERTREYIANISASKLKIIFTRFLEAGR